jgi:hypothetical protein
MEALQIGKLLFEEHVASTKTSNNDTTNSTKGTTGSTKELSKVVVQVAINDDQYMELYSVLLDKKVWMDTNIVHFRKRCTEIELEDEEKDERSGSQDVLDDNENVAKKRKCMESVKMGGPVEHKQLEQAAYISVK